MAQISADLILIPHSAGCLLDGREKWGTGGERKKAAHDDEKENG